MFFGEEEMKNTGVNVFFAKGLKTHERALLQDLHEVKIKLKYNCKYSKSLSNHYLKILEMSRMLSVQNCFNDCKGSYVLLTSCFVVLKIIDSRDFEIHIIDDGSNWLDNDDLVVVANVFHEIEGMHHQDVLDLFHTIPQQYIFMLMTLMMRYFHYNAIRLKQVYIEYYESDCAKPTSTDQHRINMGTAFKLIDGLIDDCASCLLAENHTILFHFEAETNYIWFGDGIKMKPQFALNVGVEKSRIKTLKRQAVLKAECERQRLEDEALMKVIEEAKPEKVSKQSQTKSANKKKEQEKKEREEYEKRCAIAEAERQRQLKKKQEQKKAKKSK